jgi:hypothetical protein
MSADSFLWVRNLRYLMGRIADQNLTGSTKFVWGNCMGRTRAFLQGGSYFMSRKAVTYLAQVIEDWYDGLISEEDVEFTNALGRIKLNPASGNSEFILGQYRESDERDNLDAMNFSLIQNCQKVEMGSPLCGSFLGRYNRVVLLQKRWAGQFDRPAVPVYKYPDNLYWTMGTVCPRFCLN